MGFAPAVADNGISGAQTNDDFANALYDFGLDERMIDTRYSSLCSSMAPIFIARGLQPDAKVHYRGAGHDLISIITMPSRAELPDAVWIVSLVHACEAQRLNIPQKKYSSRVDWEDIRSMDRAVNISACRVMQRESGGVYAFEQWLAWQRRAGVLNRDDARDILENC